MSITTKKGDDGYTDIIGGKRLPKDHPVLECLGAVDELNAFLGEAKAALAASCKETQPCTEVRQDRGSPLPNEPEAMPTTEIITEIQKGLFVLMGVIAGMPVPAGGIGEDRLNTLIEKLESELQRGLPPRGSSPTFSSFAVPGTNLVSAKLHIARTVCRRAERRLVSLSRVEKTETAVVQYINRLSDLLFLLAQKEE